ncbi:GlcG/HbpS family heme-binding protein [Elioraea rosea]|uniref:GlcG/HbpS family heme-binding protein n=1 Tax=Elioraea rosea TaxID=2492390 RepID=UPI001950129C|nr:heme-binding protein [Elioraea rosea]
MMRQALLAATALLMGGGAQAQLIQERTVSLAAAQALALAAVEACAARNFNVAATVVDRAGVVRAMLRADRAGPHTLGASRKKAYTSASARNATSAMAQAAETNPGARNLVHIPGFLLLGGGVPIRAGDEVVGAIGVGGAPSGQIDEECANAALEKHRDMLR